MGIADNFASKHPGKWIGKSISASVKIIKGGKLAQSFPREIDRSQTLTNHSEVRVSGFFNPLPFR
jgi:hypothetical protein